MKRAREIASLMGMAAMDGALAGAALGASRVLRPGETFASLRNAARVAAEPAAGHAIRTAVRRVLIELIPGRAGAHLAAAAAEVAVQTATGCVDLARGRIEADELGIIALEAATGAALALVAAGAAAAGPVAAAVASAGAAALMARIAASLHAPAPERDLGDVFAEGSLAFARSVEETD